MCKKKLPIEKNYKIASAKKKIRKKNIEKILRTKKNSQTYKSSNCTCEKAKITNKKS